MSVAKQLSLFSPRTADRYRLQQIQFPQSRAYAIFRGFRPVVQDLAAILLVLVKWDYDRFCEFQGALADLVTAKCQPVHPVTKEPIEYTDRQIRGALKTLEKEGYIIIPRSVAREEKLAKIYGFTSTFKALLNNPVALPVVELAGDAGDAGAKKSTGDSISKPVPGGSKRCDNSPLRPKPAVSETTGNNSTLPNSQLSVVNIKESRAIDRTSRDRFEKNSTGGDSQPKKTVYSRSQLPKDLSPIQRQMIHWLSGCSLLTGQAESIKLCGDFISRPDEEQIAYWVQRWPELGKSEKSFAVRQLIRALRNLPPAVTYTPPSVTAVLSTDPGPELGSDPKLPPQFELSQFRAALLFSKPYDGPGQAFIERFRESDQPTQDLMMMDLQRRIKTKQPLFDD
jgi:hypothetical protein